MSDGFVENFGSTVNPAGAPKFPATRLEALEAEVRMLREALSGYSTGIYRATQENQALREALSFYADGDNWIPVSGNYIFTAEPIGDPGHRARDVLRRLEHGD